MGHPLLLCTTVLVFCHPHHKKKNLHYILNSIPCGELGLTLHKVTHFRLPKLPNCCPSAEPSIMTIVLFMLPLKCASLKPKIKWDSLKSTGLGLDLCLSLIMRVLQSSAHVHSCFPTSLKKCASHRKVLRHFLHYSP